MPIIGVGFDLDLSRWSCSVAGMRLSVGTRHTLVAAKLAWRNKCQANSSDDDRRSDIDGDDGSVSLQRLLVGVNKKLSTDPYHS